MHLLSAIHRWCGALIGLLLALIGLSGAILVWEGAWISLPGADDPVQADVASIAAITEAAAARGPLETVTFAGSEIGLHQMIYANGGGAYVRQDGTIVDQWATQWERPELWLFDLHHYLFAGHAGELTAGIAGIAGLLFVATGLVLWWRSRRSFAPRVLPKRFAPGAIVSHHRDVGVLAAPLLILSMLSGTMMLFEPIRSALLGKEERPKTSINLMPASNLEAVLASAAKLFPHAELRRINLPRDPREPITVRLRQQFEWTPNGRTFVRFNADGSTGVEDPATANRASGVTEKLYPLHSAKVGGLTWKLLMTVSGVALALLGSLATWSFWVRRAGKQRRRAPQKIIIVTPV